MELYKLKISKASLDRYDVECKSDSSEMKKEFDDLIHEFLTDGFIDEKERSVLIKKAQKLGIDPDEADLYITAQQQKYDNVIDSAKEKEKGKKCPHCYKPVHELTDLCPYCFEPMTPKASKELEEILDKLEDALVSMKSWKDFDKNKAIVERYERKARMYYSNHPKVRALLAEVEREKLKAESQFKSMERKETITSIIKWVWSALAIVIGLVVAAVGIEADVPLVGITGFGLIIGGIYGLLFASGVLER